MRRGTQKSIFFLLFQIREHCKGAGKKAEFDVLKKIKTLSPRFFFSFYLFFFNEYFEKWNAFFTFFYVQIMQQCTSRRFTWRIWEWNTITVTSFSFCMQLNIHKQYILKYVYFCLFAYLCLSDMEIPLFGLPWDFFKKEISWKSILKKEYFTSQIKY